MRLSSPGNASATQHSLESSELSMNLHASVTPHTLLLAVYLIGEGEGAQNELMPVVGSKENSFKHG